MIRNKINEGLVFIINVNEDKYQFVASLGKLAIDFGFSANDLVKLAASLADGKGGGKSDLAQAGGINKGNIDDIEKALLEKIK